MKQLTAIGRFLYGITIAALGIHQLIINDFRPEILPPFPAWAHQYSIFPILTGIAFLLAGIIIAGLFIKPSITKKVCLYLAYFFLILFIACHLPYILYFNTAKASRLEVWFGAAEELSYAGGALVMAASFQGKNGSGSSQLMAPGRIFYSILILIFGCSHFVFKDAVAALVPTWLGVPFFWTYFVGAALISSAIAIIFNIWIKMVALLLALMLFLFFIFFHVPDAVAHPSAGGGNEIFRAMVALLFCGIALVIASTNGPETNLQKR